jgi:sodium pump decarboxylase gamma subunit
MTESDSILRLAGMTTMVGMGVVFSALFLLSVYMNVFKRILGKWEADRKNKAEAVAQKATDAPVVEPVSGSTEEAQVAAAIGLGLYLDGVRGGVPAEITAAIMTALHIHMNQPVYAAPSVTTEAAAVGGWKVAGWMESQAMRLQVQAQARRPSPPPVFAKPAKPARKRSRAGKAS